MRWYIRGADGSTTGPFEEADIVASLRAGHHRADLIAADSAGDRWTPLSAHPPFAGALEARRPHAGGAARSDAMGTLLLAAPLIGAALAWVLAGASSSSRDPGAALILVALGTVLVTAALIALDAAQLGMGRIRNADGKLDSGPLSWLVAAVFLWIVVYPSYLFTRGAYGRARRAWVAVLVAFTFAGAIAITAGELETRRLDSRARLEALHEQLRDLRSALEP